MRLHLFFILSLLGISGIAQTTRTWTGSTSTDWQTASNWSPSGVPASTDPVIINSATNQPVLDGSTSIASLTVNTGAVLNLGSYNLTVNGSFTSNSASVNNGSLITGTATVTSCAFGAKLTSNGVTIQLRNNTFNEKVTITQTGSTNTTSYGNTFNEPTRLINSSAGFLSFGVGVADIFNDSLFATVTASKALYLAHSSAGNQFNSYVEFNKTSSATSTGVFVGSTVHSTILKAAVTIKSVAPLNWQSAVFTNCTFDSLATLVVNSGSFTHGQLSFVGCRIHSAANITLGSSAQLLLGTNTIVHNNFVASTASVILGAVEFKQHCSITKTGSSTDLSGGPVICRSTNLFKNSGTGYFWLGNNGANKFYQGLSVENSGAGTLQFTLTNAADSIVGTTNITTSAGILVLGTAGGVNQPLLVGDIALNISGGGVFLYGLKQASTGTITASTFSGGLMFNGFKQLGTSPINLSGSGNFTVKSGSEFRGDLTVSAGRISVLGGEFFEEVFFNQTGSFATQGEGYPVFHKDVEFKCSGTGVFQLNYPYTTFTYHEDLILNNASGGLQLGYAGTHAVKGDVIYKGAYNINGWSNKIVLNGTLNQAIKREHSFTPTILRLDINKPSGIAVLETPLVVLLDLSLLKGELHTSAINLLTLGSAPTITGGSDSSYVVGPLSRTGTTAFTFPLGGNGSYAPLGIDAVASSCTFKASYIAEDPDPLFPRSQKDTTLGFVNRCGYWNLDRTSGTQNTKVTLGWSNNPCFAPNPSDVKVTSWGSSLWIGNGNSSNSGNSQYGNVKSNSTFSVFPINLNLGGECDFSVSLQPNNDSLYSGYLSWYTASPGNQLSYSFYLNSSLEQDGFQNSLSSLNFLAGDTVNVIATSVDYCSASAISVVPTMHTAPTYDLVEELFLDWSTSAGSQSLFINQKHALKTDDQKNVYIAGSSINSDGNYDILVAKYDSLGNEIWLNQFAGSAGANDIGTDLFIDNQYNVYVTGTVVESIADSNDIVVLKYENDGDLAWSQTYNGPDSGNDGAIAISQIDGGIYVSGMVTNSIWPLTDFALLKLNTSGSILWNKVYDNGLFDICTGHRKTATNEVTLEGGTQVGITTFKYMAVRYDTLGSLIDTTLSGTISNQFRKLNSVKRDMLGKIYLTGSTDGSNGIDMLTVVLNSQLDIQWSHVYNSSGNLRDEAFDLTYDTSGNVYVVGYSETNSTGTDYRLTKYSPSGSLLWTSTFDGVAHAADTARAVHFGEDQLISITGSSFNGSNDDFYTIQYDASGVKQHEREWNSWDNGNDRPTAIAVDDANAVLVYGQSEDAQGALKYSTLRYMKKGHADLPTSNANNGSSAFLENRDQLRMDDSSSSSSISYYSTQGYPETYFYADTVSYVFRKSGFDVSGSPMDSLQRIDLWFETDRPIEPFLASKQLEGFTNFYYPHISPGRERVPEHKTLLRKEVWKNIDIQYGDVPSPGFTAIIHKTARPNDIKLKFEGQNQLSINSEGNLEIKGEFETIEFYLPRVYQVYPGNEKVYLPWQPKYSLNSNRVTLTQWGAYNSNNPLMVEFVVKQKGGTCQTPYPPAIRNLYWSSYYGGSSNEITTDVAAGNDNSSYLCGRTKSFVDFPLDIGFQTNAGLGLFDAFAVGFRYDASRKWATFYGGDGYDSFNSMVINEKSDINEKLYVVGRTNSSSNSFQIVTSEGAYNKTTNSGLDDGIICRFNEDDGDIVWSSFIGGEGIDDARAITVDGYGNVYMALNVQSSNAEDNNCQATNGNSLPLCPTNNGYFANENSGGQDIFIAKFNLENQLNWSTFFGSHSVDVIMDAHFADFGSNGNPEVTPGNLYLVGTTSEMSGPNSNTLGAVPNNEDFPLTDLNTGSNNYYEESTLGFISKFNPTGSLKWSTNINTKPQSVTSSDKAVFVTGLGTNPKVACNAEDAEGFTPICQLEGGSFILNGDGYVAKFNKDDELVWSTAFKGKSKTCGDGIGEGVYNSYSSDPELYIHPSFEDICPLNPTNEKVYDIVANSNGTFYIIGTHQGSLVGDEILLLENINMYYDRMFALELGGTNNQNGYYTEAFVLGYSNDNFQFWGTYFGQETSGIQNFTIAATGRGTDFGKSIAYSENSNSLYIAGHSFAQNACFPFEEAPFIGNETPFFQNSSSEDSYNSFIARFDINEDLLSLNVENIKEEYSSGILFPNPTTGIVTVKFDKFSSGNIVVSNLLGQFVIQEKTNGYTQMLNLTTLNSGLYFITFHEEGGTEVQTFKVLKQ